MDRRIVAWANSETGSTEYLILVRDRNTNYVLDTVYSKSEAQQIIDRANANDKIAEWPWKNGRILPSQFKESCNRDFGFIPSVIAIFAEEIDKRGTDQIPGTDLYLTWTSYNGWVEVAYVS